MLSWIWIIILIISLLSATLEGNGNILSASIFQGAQSGFSLAVSIGGSLCLWSGVGRLMDAAGLTGQLSQLLGPLLYRIFPSARSDCTLRRDLSGNICANLLGLGNAATPLGIRAAQRLRSGDAATDELCRLVVLNTASIQLLPTTVASVRTALGCATPLDILPAVWITSLCSAGLGLCAAAALGGLARRD